MNKIFVHSSHRNFKSCAFVSISYTLLKLVILYTFSYGIFLSKNNIETLVLFFQENGRKKNLY